MSQERTVVDMQWLANGEQDPHPRYIKIGRDDLAGTHLLSDDELAYSLAMMSTISDERDTAMMIDSHRTNGDYISKSTLGEIAKDRIRWLSRRVAVLEGRYPGFDKPRSKEDPLVALQELCKAKGLHLDIAYEHSKGGWVAPGWASGVYTLPALVDAIIQSIHHTDDEFIIRADEPTYIERAPIDSPATYQLYVAEARLQQQVPLLVGWLGLNNNSTHRDITEALEQRKVKVDPMKVGIAVGFAYRDELAKRWQVYVSLARDLLKQGVYIPFADDTYHINPNGTVFISASKYYTAASKAHTVRIRIERAEPSPLDGLTTPALVVDPAHQVIDTFSPADQQQLDLRAEAVEAMAEEIYDGWQDKEGWTPWVPKGNSDMQFEARKEARALIGG